MSIVDQVIFYNDNPFFPASFGKSAAKLCAALLYGGKRLRIG
jgi:hypothetical protein